MEEVTFGRYRLIELIGKGGMGQVYKAHDTAMGRDVAIKVLPRELATQPDYEQRFRREASVAARLSEPHIIPIFEAGEIDGRLYLVMPVIEGIDVHTLLRRDGPMSPQRAVHVIEQLAAALNAAHQRGLVHRDIKPSNALITGDDFVYLIDFGIAHDTAATRLTHTGMMVGTLAYMAPERLSAGIADARADVYSLTCVLYECLTGAAPYSGDSMEQQITGHLTLDPPKPSQQRPGVAVGFDEVIAAGMAKNPDQRYQNARELAAAARDALTAVPTAARDAHPGPALHADLTVPAGVYDPRSASPAGAHEPMWHPLGHPALAAGQRPPHPGGPVTPPPWQPASHGARHRRLALGVVAALVAVLALVGAGIYLATKDSNPVAATTSSATTAPTVVPAPATTTATTIATPNNAAPLAEDVLDGLLLTPEEMNTTMGTTQLTVKIRGLWWSDAGDISTPECLPLTTPMQKDVYAGSGWTAARSREFNESDEPSATRRVAFQGVVLFPSAQDAAAFVSSSLQKWSACANRPYSQNFPAPIGIRQWRAGPVTNNDGVLTATTTQEHASGWVCQRALTARNNVVIDVAACGRNIIDEAVRIAGQSAAKVPTT